MTPSIPGADAVVSWFGQWPSFHDAEVLSVHLNRGGRSQIRIYTFLTSDRVDTAGRFIRQREAILVFEFQEISAVKLEGTDADRQNVIAGLVVEQADDAFRLQLAPCYGLSGEIVATELSVHIEGPS